MSYILEALRKAERERQLGEAPTLSDVIYDAPSKGRNGWPWLVALLLLLNAGLMGYFWLNGWGQNPPIATSALADPTPPKVSADEKPATRIASAPTSNAPMAASPKVITPAIKPLLNPAKKSSLSREALEGESSPSKNSNKALGTEQANRRPANAPNTPIIDKAFVRGEQEPEPVNEPPPVANWEIPKAVESEPGANLPSLREMPDDIQQKLPDIKINVLAYSSEPEERFAIINMVRYNRGEHLPGGAVLREIQANGVVLELNGKRFRVPHR